MKPPDETKSQNEELARINTILTEAFNESERHGIVMLGAEIDNILTILLERHLLKVGTMVNGQFKPNKDTDSIYSTEGFAGTCGRKIELCARLGLIHPFNYEELKIINRIRNAFAHGAQGVSLEDEKLKALCFNLKIGQGIEAQMKARFPPKTEEDKKKSCLRPRDRLLFTAINLLTILSISRINVKLAKPVFPPIMQGPPPSPDQMPIFYDI
jgi:hypothetical protein